MLYSSVWIVKVEKIIIRNNFESSSKKITYEKKDIFFKYSLIHENELS